MSKFEIMIEINYMSGVFLYTLLMYCENSPPVKLNIDRLQVKKIIKYHNFKVIGKNRVRFIKFLNNR